MKYQSMCNIVRSHHFDEATKAEMAVAVKNDDGNGIVYVVLEDTDGQSFPIAGFKWQGEQDEDYWIAKDGVYLSDPLPYFRDYFDEEREITDELIAKWKLEY